MNQANKARIAWGLKCKPEEVPETDEGIKEAVELRIKEVRAKKKAKHG